MTTRKSGRGAAAAGALAIALLAAATAGWAAPLDPALQASLLQIYDRYNQAITAGHMREAKAMLAKKSAKSEEGVINLPMSAKEEREFALALVPDSFDVLHGSLAKSGDSASIITLAHKKSPDGTMNASEITLSFVKQGGAWMMGDQLLGGDPSKIKHCPNPAFEPVEAYDENRNTEVGGPITRVAFEADYTLVVVRVFDEENCVFLPSRAALKAAGMNPDQLVPYAIAEFDGIPHKSDSQKAWAEKFTLDEEP